MLLTVCLPYMERNESNEPLIARESQHVFASWRDLERKQQLLPLHWNGTLLGAAKNQRAVLLVLVHQP
eukprot:427045-Hanusia_phi.AAC.7